MRKICASCKEQFNIDSEKVLMCPFCNSPILDKNIYYKIKDNYNNYNEITEQDVQNILDKEKEVYTLINGTVLNSVRDYIEAFFKLLKDKNAEWKYKLLSMISLLYIINPIDLIPDMIPGIGFIDDFAALSIAVAYIGKAINKYYEKNKNKVILNNDTIIYNISSDNHNISTVKIKKNMIIWRIPVNKKDKIKIRTINGKAIKSNETYVLTTIADSFLTPLNNFDTIIVDSILNETINILKSLGAKKISLEKTIAIASEKNIVTDSEFLNVFDNNIKIKSNKIKKQESRINYEFGELDIEDMLNEDELINNMSWYYTDNSILDNTIFSDRLKKAMLRASIEKEMELTSLLDTDCRVNIKKDKKMFANININEATKIKWKVKVEYYPINKQNIYKTSELYNSLITKIEQKKKILNKNVFNNTQI